MILAHQITIRERPERLPAGKLKHQELVISAASTNAGTIWLAGDEAGLSVQGTGRYPLEPGQSLKLKLDRADSLFVWGDNVGDVAFIVAETA